MAKFTTDYVNLISSNLRDRYKSGFPILKELVQNADDAGATSLILGYHDGLAHAADHELLHGPALWVLNNGRFKAEDKRAITKFGVNSKAAETGAIGKFGLGMKSVFHLCEAFFYVASDGEQGYDEVLNPWFEESNAFPMHEAWERRTPRDIKALNDVAAASPLAQPGQSWFMLWVPLRRRSHVPQVDGMLTAPIIDRYPGDDAGRDLDFFTEAGMDRRIGGLLPLLRCLRTVEFAGTTTRPAFRLQIDLADRAQRLDHRTDGLTISGTVDDGGPNVERLHFMARQAARIGEPPFAGLQSLPGWPKTNAIVEQGRRGSVRDKGEPEGAVAFAHADGRRGRLSLQWAVFLPTDEKRFRYEAVIPGGSREYSVALHGQFFVDAGRRGIEGIDQIAGPIVEANGASTESVVQLAWNQTLAQQVVLPMLLPSLAAYVRSEGFSDAEIAALTDALTRCTLSGESGQGAGFIATFRAHVCREHVWARVLRSEGPTWELLPAREGRVLPLPKPANNDHERPWRALPGLRALGDTTFVDAVAPFICEGLPQWDDEAVCRVIEDIPAATLSGEVELRYLLEFLRMHEGVALGMEHVQARLVVALRRALRGLRLADMRNHRMLFQEVIGLLWPSLRYGIGARDKDAKRALPESIYRRLLSVQTDALLVPADLVPEKDAGSPRASDVEKWLGCLGALVEEGVDIPSCLDAAEALIKAGGPNEEAQHDLLRRWPRLRILRAIDVARGGEIACSLEILLDAHRRGQLFRIGDALDVLGLTGKLSQAVPGLRPLVVNKFVGSLVESAHQPGNREVPKTNSETAVFRTIGMQDAAPELGAHEQRAPLLDSVAMADLSIRTVREGVRYLLHGTSARFRSDEPLWKDPSGTDEPWVRLWRMVEADSWNVLHVTLSRHLTDQNCAQLGVRPVDQQTVTEHLRRVGQFDGVDGTQFTESERDRLLGAIKDDTIWRGLPLHRDQHGGFGTALADCYLGTFPELPSDFEHGLRFIVSSSDDAHGSRQNELIPRWSVAHAGRALLKAENPARYWLALMNLLPHLERIEIAGPWKEVPWLPLASGGTIALSSLVRLDTMRADITDLASQCDYAYAGSDDLANAVRTHSAFEQLKERMPSDALALDVLAQMMANAGHFIGRRAHLDAGSLERLRGVLASLESLPAWALVYKAVNATSSQDVASRLIGEIAQPLPTERLEVVLLELADQVLNQPVLEAFLVYLKEWADSASADELRRRLPALRLPAANGVWRPASELVAGAFGIDPPSLVHADVLAILSDIVVKNDAAPQPPAEPVAVDDYAREDLKTALENWCAPLAEHNVGQAVGALLGMFGSGARALCERWIQPIAYGDYLLRLNWKDPGYDPAFNRKEWMGGYGSPGKPFEVLKPVFVESAGSEVRVLSLTGAELVLPLTDVDSMSTLLAGNLNWLGGYGVEVRMRPMDCLRDFDAQRQKEILRHTAEELLKHLYNQKHPDLTELWRLFEQSDQMELGVARSLILEGLPQLVLQWPAVKRHPKVDEVLRAVDKARRERQSALSAGSDLRGCEVRLMQALNDLAKRVETDESVQQAMLGAVRKKLLHFQYERSSVPFELLQNADDAVLELQMMQADEGRQPYTEVDIGRFVVASTGTSVVFMHWGRAINTTGKRGGYREDHAKDLERMLMLGASGKEEEDGLTGKFGLGFKSVLLVADQPVVESGGLHFEIVAGCLPQRAELSIPAKAVAARYRQAGLRSTIVELPLGADVAGALLSRFASLAGICSAFTQQVRHIDVDGVGHAWRPKHLLEAHGARCELGNVLLPHARGPLPGRLLVLRCALGEMAMRLEGCAVPFEDDADHPVPAIWVNAPTRGMPATGMILNASFDIDTGRGSLPQGAAASHNRKTAARLAEALAPLVTKLMTSTMADWASWSHELSTSPQLSAAEFWHAFWTQVLGDKPSSDASQDALLVAEFASELFARVVEYTGVVPNGLRGASSGFARIDELRLAVACDRYQEVLPILLDWPAFTSVYPPASWCAREVRDWLARRPEADDETPIDELARQSVPRALGTHARVSPEDFSRLAEIVEVWPQTNLFEVHWRAAFSPLQMRAQSGAWKPADQLFTDLGKSDPLRRFAPADFLPDSAYDARSEAWEMLQEHLGARPLYAQEVARWCVEAASKDSQAAAISWLAEHLNSEHVWRAINLSPLRSQWIGGLHAGHELLARLPEVTRNYVLSLLGLGDAAAMDDDIETNDPATQLDFDMIHDWWEAHRDEHLPKYERALWPQRINRQRLADDPADRETWMTLFSLGVFRRFGRVRDAQNRGFLDFLERRDWWHTISQLHPDTAADEWMAILREYADASQVSDDFEQWMDSFPRLYRVARWFDVYVDLFRGLQYRSAEEAAYLLTPAMDASLSGTGITAPTLGRTLHLGHHLVIRELLRTGVLTSEVARSLAFMPGKGVRNLLEAMGHGVLETSENIHELLVDELGDVDRASFCGDFDIPLILLANHQDLQREVVRWAAERDGLHAWETEEEELL